MAFFTYSKYCSQYSVKRPLSRLFSVVQQIFNCFSFFCHLDHDKRSTSTTCEKNSNLNLKYPNPLYTFKLNQLANFAKLCLKIFSKFYEKGFANKSIPIWCKLFNIFYRYCPFNEFNARMDPLRKFGLTFVPILKTLVKFLPRPVFIKIHHWLKQNKYVHFKLFLTENKRRRP